MKKSPKSHKSMVTVPVQSEHFIGNGISIGNFSSTNCAFCNQTFSPVYNKPTKRFLYNSGISKSEVPMWSGVLEILNWDWAQLGSKSGDNLYGETWISKNLAVCSICGTLFAKIYTCMKLLETIRNRDSYLGQLIPKYWKRGGSGYNLELDSGELGETIDSSAEGSSSVPDKTPIELQEEEYVLFQNEPKNPNPLEPDVASGTLETGTINSSSPKPNLCYICGAGFLKHNNLKRHLLLSHEIGERTKEFICEECGKSYFFAYLLRNHQKVHTDDRPFLCGVEGCGLKFKQKLGLRHHVQTVHNPDPESCYKFPCRYCSKIFKGKRDWRWHEEYVHRIPKGKKYFKCPHCGHRYHRERTRKEHEKVCELNPKNMEAVSGGTESLAAFTDAGAIQFHVPGTEEQQQLILYQCPKNCGKVFSSKNELEAQDQYYSTVVHPVVSVESIVENVGIEYIVDSKSY